MDFSTAFDKLMTWEGGGVLHRDTRGIPTKWGVAQSAHPDVDVENLTKEDAMRIARQLYWVPAGANVVPEPIRYPLFDFAYNAGVSRAVQTLQWAMNVVVEARGLDWPLLAEDGQAGPNTKARSLALTTEAPFIKRCYTFRRMEFYMMIAGNSEGHAASLNGWLRRALETV